MSTSQTHHLTRHPILPVEPADLVPFTFDGRPMLGRAGEAVSSALFANGVHAFGKHARDGSPQGLFCANGQCAQCTLIIDGVPLKSCIVPLRSGMRVESAKGLPMLLETPGPDVDEPRIVRTQVLVMGGGPAGLSACIELGRAGVKALLVDDKARLGGKLVLQTHKFFGSIEDCHAGTRGIDIASKLAQELEAFPTVDVWLESVVLAVFSDGKIGVRRPDGYALVEAEQVLVATGAREKSLPFPGNTLPGVYGAGAFQTLVNRDQVRCARRLLVIGGGNVGLIGAYHALQAGMQVAALVEALPKCGGYKVHADKILRLGVPIYTSHSILAVHGTDHVHSATITKIDGSFQPVPGTEKTFEVDTVLVAVGLNPVNELLEKARGFGLNVRSAGDAEEIAEASAAMFCGRMRGIEIARELGATQSDVPSDLAEKADVLKRPAGARHEYHPPQRREGVFPVLHCAEEIPCNPCMTVCPKGCIRSTGHPILGVPVFDGPCDGCLKCVAICPGLAISLVDFRKQAAGRALVTLPFELGGWLLQKGDEVALTDWEGGPLGKGVVRKVMQAKAHDRTTLLRVEVAAEVATAVAGVRMLAAVEASAQSPEANGNQDDQAYVCRCERVTMKEIRDAIHAGVRDLNELKGVCRSGMGACGGKTCGPIVQRICREEGLKTTEVTPFTSRPLFAETQLGYFAGRRNDDD